jgi:hypothetical protein
MPAKLLCQAIINWFEWQYGYIPDPSRTPDGEILRWALLRRQADRYAVEGGRPGEPEYHH